jgi:KUP system potassium uptake protein
VREPGVLLAMSPHHLIGFVAEDPGRALLVLGAVFLVVTGGEALYADLGHFGHRAIQMAWFGVGLPALMLNYFGQGALLLRDPSAAVNPFYHLAPTWGLYPLIMIATAAAIIASQAVISGSFSLTRQAVQLGYIPRLQIDHTSSREIGQIYVPAVNWGLMVLTCLLVLGYKTSSNMAGAYGVALSTLMVITTLMFAVMSREVWQWTLTRVLLVAAVFLAMDVPFLVANALKIPHGGWVPLAVAIGVYVVMATWKRGRAILYARLQERSIPWNLLLADLAADPPMRVPGTAVFMTGNPGSTPPALVHNLTHNKVLHEQVVFLSVITRDVPHVPEAERAEVEALGKSTYAVVAHYGFMDDPDVTDVIAACKLQGLKIEMAASTFFMGRETLISTDRPGMARWRERLFAFMSRNALRATAFYQIPAEQVFEVGAQVEL